MSRGCLSHNSTKIPIFKKKNQMLHRRILSTNSKARTTLQDFIVLYGSEKLIIDPLIRNRTVTGMLSCMNKSPNRHGFRDSTNFACVCTNKLGRRLIACVRSVRKGRERGFRTRERREKRVGSARGARGRNLLSLPWQATT